MPTFLPTFKWVYQTDDVLASFSAKNPKSLIENVPWVITKSTRLNDAVDRLTKLGLSDLIVLDQDTGIVLGMLSAPESTSLRRKWRILLELQVSCHDMCAKNCANSGGCGSHGVVPKPGGGWTCIIDCAWDNTTVGGILDQIPAQ